jgi:hypothetical protein
MEGNRDPRDPRTTWTRVVRRTVKGRAVDRHQASRGAVRGPTSNLPIAPRPGAGSPPASLPPSRRD